MNGRLDGKGGLSPKSLRLHKNVLFQALTDAVRNQLLSSNPCQFVQLPQKERKEAHFYSATQMQTLFATLQNDPLLPLVKITAIYGLRRSELLGLQWNSIDEERGTLAICHTVVKVTSVVEKDKTKNRTSRRAFPLTPEARAIFAEAKRKEIENRRLFGADYTENPYVFKWDDGQPYSPDYISHRFNDLLKKHGLPHIRFHEIRHSCASLLINAGTPLKDVQDWMGHADIRMTADLYGHLDVSRKQQLAATISDTLSSTC